PVSTLAALKGAELIASALDEDPAERDRATLALGSILCAYAIDSALFALHHVLCQTLVRVCSLPHAETNATMLPRTMAAMRERAPDKLAALAEAIGTTPERIGERIEELSGGPRTLSELGAEPDRVDDVVSAASARQELQLTPSPPSPEELRALIDAAW